MSFPSRLGTLAGVTAFLLDKYMDAKENFIPWSLVTAFGGFYIASIVALVKALSAKGTPCRSCGTVSALARRIPAALPTSEGSV
ncbi:MAG TPA: hypothetical protein VIM08_01395 [Arthrobacter sp.]